jgi:hypothetical protein
MVGILGIAVGLVFLGQARLPEDGDVSLSERPILSVAGLNSKDIVSVSRYKNTDKPAKTTVFRYCYRGEFKAIVREFQSRLTKKGGWSIEWMDPSQPYDIGKVPIISRVLTSRPVTMQALVFHPNRMLPAPHGGRILPAKDSKGWVWVSYNEQVPIAEKAATGG